MKVRILLVLAVLGATGSSASAQTEALHLATVERPVAATAKAPRLLDDREVEARLASADRALKRGSPARARAIYSSLAARLRSENRLPTLVVWRLAALEYGSGSPLKAAALLDELAAEAAAARDVTVQIMSLFEAAHVYGLEGSSKDAEERLDRGVRLLGSAELPMETRVALMRKVRG